jgi:hypothetical protein
MAKKRKAKRRKAEHQLSPTTSSQHQTAISTSDLGSAEPESSDGASTDPRGSESARTDMTSIMEPDLEPVEQGLVADLEVDDHEELSDSDSAYAPSSYPRVMPRHQVEYPYRNGRMERDAQTL